MCLSWGSPESEAYILGRLNPNWMRPVLCQHSNPRRYRRPFICEPASTRAVTEEPLGVVWPMAHDRFAPIPADNALL